MIVNTIKYVIILACILASIIVPVKMINSVDRLTEAVKVGNDSEVNLNRCEVDLFSIVIQIEQYEEWLGQCVRMQIACEDYISRAKEEISRRKRCAI